MGFFDTQENIRALQATRGNVHAAVERLLGNMGQWGVEMILPIARFSEMESQSCGIGHLSD